MNSSDLKKLLISSLDSDQNPEAIRVKLEKEGVQYDFSKEFTGKVLEKVFLVKSKAAIDIEFLKYLNFTFSRIALTGVAAIAVLLISIFLMEGSITFNSILGLTDNYDEGIVYLLTGN